MDHRRKGPDASPAREPGQAGGSKWPEVRLIGDGRSVGMSFYARAKARSRMTATSDSEAAN